MTEDYLNPVFEEVWHAKLFAVTVLLNECGYFTWHDWVVKFGKFLHDRGLKHPQNGGNDYFMAWLDALEDFLYHNGITDLSDLNNLKRKWKDAYLSTPHGSPVSVKQKP